jgi:F0F1-type ATP synthase membrane subunit b/b'
MSGIETVKIIVDAEKEASEMLQNAHAKATEIRKELDMRIKREREEVLKSARKEAATIIENAQRDGKLEAAAYEKEAGQKTRQVVTKASAKKGPAVEKLVSLILESKT